MAIESAISSPRQRSQPQQTTFPPESLKKPSLKPGEMGDCSTLIKRHYFLLTALVLLAFLCSVYLYFAVTFGDGNVCSGLEGAQKTGCRLKMAKETIAKGKLKVF